MKYYPIGTVVTLKGGNRPKPRENYSHKVLKYKFSVNTAENSANIRPYYS